MNRRWLPLHLPRVEMMIYVEDKTCPCCRYALYRIGEDRSERLDILPARLPGAAARVRRASAQILPAGPAKKSWCKRRRTRLIEGGLPTEATVAQVLVSKCADHPLFRQAQICAWQGVTLDRSILAYWVGPPRGKISLFLLLVLDHPSPDHAPHDVFFTGHAS